jgi:acetone carboxylase gamma subunit
VRDYYCPGCVVLLEVEVAQPDDPLLVDVELELAGAAK